MGWISKKKSQSCCDVRIEEVESSKQSQKNNQQSKANIVKEQSTKKA